MKYIIISLRGHLSSMIIFQTNVELEDAFSKKAYVSPLLSNKPGFVGRWKDLGWLWLGNCEGNMLKGNEYIDEEVCVCFTYLGIF